MSRPGRGEKGTWIQLLILKILYKTPSHGYSLIEKVNSYQRGRRPIKPGSLYTILRRMEKEGLLESNWDDNKSLRKRRVYNLSADGVQRLMDGRKMVKNQLIILKDIQEFYDEYFTKPEVENQE